MKNMTIQKEKLNKINFITIFPNFYKPFVTESIIKRGIEKKLIEINIIDFRKFADNKHNKIDDIVYGGGQGMLLMVEPIDKAINSLPKSHIVLMSPQGKTFTQAKAKELSKHKNITFIAGHYEGFDERVRSLVHEEISIGDYVLTGGELPSMVVADAVIRLLPNIINSKSHENDSFSNDLLDFPQYTRPREYKGMKVPEVLLNGHHKLINE
jgi:tRNA (guanine37-N1)-methyltransferase